MMRFRSTRTFFALLGVGVLAFDFPAALSAQAFGLNEIGSCAVGRSFAVAAAPCRDASTIFWNPGAATWLSGWSAIAGVASVSVNGDFEQDTTFRKFDADVPTEYIPHFFVNYHNPKSRFAWGLGVYVPYGLTSQWGDDFPGRFTAKRARLFSVYIQPNVAWKVNDKWSIGGGPIVGYSSVELTQALDLSAQEAQPGVTFGMLGVPQFTEFGLAKLKGHATAFGAQIGVAGHITDDWHVGLRALSPLRFKYDDADATFAQTPTGLVVGGTIPGTPIVAGTPFDSLVAPQFRAGGALVDQGVSTRIVHPGQVQLGVAYSGVKHWLIEADYALIFWEGFKDLPVDFEGPASSQNRTLIEDYRNSNALRIGVEYSDYVPVKDPCEPNKVLDPDRGLKVRAGFAAIQSAAPDETVTPLLPEQDRWYGTLGLGYGFSKRWGVDVGYNHVFTNGKRGRIVERVSREQTAEELNSGVFHLSANVFSISVKAKF